MTRQSCCIRTLNWEKCSTHANELVSRWEELSPATPAPQPCCIRNIIQTKDPTPPHVSSVTILPLKTRENLFQQFQKACPMNLTLGNLVFPLGFRVVWRGLICHLHLVETGMFLSILHHAAKMDGYYGNSLRPN